MGQYYRIFNLDKQQLLNPGRFNDGLGLREFGQSAGGVMLALAALLADGNGRGGGDIRSTHEFIGSWAGDRIVISGDYADGGRFTDASGNLHQTPGFVDISEHVLQALWEDERIQRRLRDHRQVEPPHPQPLPLERPRPGPG